MRLNIMLKRLICSCTGAVCGSLLLDERYERHLMKKIGQSEYQGLPAKSKEAALSFWRDMVKPNFGEESDCDYLDVDHFIPLPGVADQPDKNIEGGFVQLEGLAHHNICMVLIVSQKFR